MRNEVIHLDELDKIIDSVINDFPYDWLLSLEICELVDKNTSIYRRAHGNLMTILEKSPENKKLILDGLNLIK